MKSTRLVLVGVVWGLASVGVVFEGGFLAAENFLEPSFERATSSPETVLRIIRVLTENELIARSQPLQQPEWVETMVPTCEGGSLENEPAKTEIAFRMAELNLVAMLVAEDQRPEEKVLSIRPVELTSWNGVAEGTEAELDVDPPVEPKFHAAATAPAGPQPDPVTQFTSFGSGDDAPGGADTCETRGHRGGRSSRLCGSCRRCQAWTLPQPCILGSRGITLGGWVDQGVSTVANLPADRYNGVVTFNDRDGEYQMNQFWLYLEREADNGGCGWDLGGRIDFVYGTDARFTQAADGLEATWNQVEPFYQAALPQFYLDVAYNEWTIRMGHFFTILGYEVVPAPDNFFYSHAYTMQYGEPFTHTGMLFMRDYGQLSFAAGFHRGNDQFDDTDGLNALNFLGGVTWTSCSERLSLAYALSATEDGPNVDTYIHSLVGTLNLTSNLSYVIQHDYGQSTIANVAHGNSEWGGLNQYLTYTINDCWAAGMRVEWFRDRDGTRVAGIGRGNLNTGPYAGDFYEITLGLNWSPHANLRVRPEVRWDWFEPIGVAGIGPYDAGDKTNQFLFGCDLIWTF